MSPVASFRPAAAVLAVVGVVLVLAGLLVHATGADTTLMLALHAYALDADAVTGWSCLTVLGLGSSALVLLLLADRGQGVLTALLPFTFLLGGVLTHGSKFVLAWPRPAGTPIAGQLHVIGQVFSGPVSMPSGHAVTAAAAAALLCVVYARTNAARCALVLAGALIALSRVVVGAHWPSDVLGGAGVGLLVVAGVLAAAASGLVPWHAWLARHLRSAAGQRWIAVLELVAVAIVISEHTAGYPAAQPMVGLLVVVGTVSAARRWGATVQRRAVVPAADVRTP